MTNHPKSASEVAEQAVTVRKSDDGCLDVMLGNAVADHYALHTAFNEKKATETRDAIRTELAALLAADRSSRGGSPCPCAIADEPCNPRCSCKMTNSSTGCAVCARYGSDEQRRVAANRIVAAARAARTPAPSDGTPAVNPCAWTPAGTPPTGAGWYVVVSTDAYGTQYRSLARFDTQAGWSVTKVEAYLPGPLPPLPELAEGGEGMKTWKNWKKIAADLWFVQTNLGLIEVRKITIGGWNAYWYPSPRHCVRLNMERLDSPTAAKLAAQQWHDRRLAGALEEVT